MALTIYATVDDLEASPWLDTDAPDGAPRLLFWATFLVALACQRNPFGDVPASPDAEALTAATCAQAASWIALGIDPAALGIDPAAAPVKKSSVLTGDVERDTSKQADAQLAAARDLCPEAVAILTAAGLIYQPVPIGASPYDRLPQWGQAPGRLPWAESLSGEFEWPFL